MINIIWLFLVISACLYGLLSGNSSLINNEIFLSVKSGLDLIINMAPSIILWMGIMALAKESGLLENFGKIISPFLSKLFPDLKKDSKALSYIASNIACNMLGMGSAATPFGLLAMQEMQKENPDKRVASTPMITFLVLNTAGVTIIPTTVIALRLSYGSIGPSSIILPSLIATAISSVASLSLDYIIRKNLNRRN